jgi:hypothetical protein
MLFFLSLKSNEYMKKNTKIAVVGYRGMVEFTEEFKGNSNLIHGEKT